MPPKKPLPLSLYNDLRLRNITVERYDEIISGNINHFVSIIVKAGKIKTYSRNGKVVNRQNYFFLIIVSEKVKPESGHKRKTTLFLTHAGKTALPLRQENRHKLFAYA